MSKYRKKPVVIEATQWFRNGDHPEDECRMIVNGPGCIPYLSEGTVVRYFRRGADGAGDHACSHCGRPFLVHGWIDTAEGGHIVCPGDWIITGVAGERYPCKDSIFRETYEPVEELPDA